jgi:transposase-like protein
MSDTQIRCPQWAKKMFAVIKVDSEGVSRFEVACQDCRRTLARDGDESVSRVLHRYDKDGLLVETEIVRSAPPLPEIVT